MPVVRNPQYYFKEGFCWIDVSGVYLKSRLKISGIFDVLSMSLFTLHQGLPDWYFVCLINSLTIGKYSNTFINNTAHFQINDARQIPVIVPSNEVLKQLEILFMKAVSIKQKQSNENALIEGSEQNLLKIQSQIDNIVIDLYHSI